MKKRYDYFVPKNDALLAQWLINFKQKIPTIGAVLGLTPAEISELENFVQILLDAINKVEVKKREQEEAVAAKDLAKEKELVLIKAAIGRMKRLPGYTANMGSELGAIGSVQTIQVDAVKPVISLGIVPGGVKVFFNKKNMAAVSVYSRLKGTNGWTLLGIEDSSPFIDSRPLSEAEKAEIREYMAICRTSKAEVGVPSAIETVVFAG